MIENICRLVLVQVVAFLIAWLVPFVEKRHSSHFGQHQKKIRQWWTQWWIDFNISFPLQLYGHLATWYLSNPKKSQVFSPPTHHPASVMLKIWRFPVETPTYSRREIFRCRRKVKSWIHRNLLWSMKLKLNPSPNMGRMTAWRWHLFPCKGEILLMEEIPHQLRLVVYPLIYKVLCNPRWFFGISEPSTVRLQRQYESSEPKKPVPQKNSLLLQLLCEVHHNDTLATCRIRRKRCGIQTWI